MIMCIRIFMTIQISPIFIKLQNVNEIQEYKLIKEKLETKNFKICIDVSLAFSKLVNRGNKLS